jgi:predicted MPP superfamily phosphohydrolase
MEENIADTKRLSRRKFLRRSIGGLGATAATTLLYTWRLEPHWVAVEHVEMPLANLPTALVGKRIVQLSDLHAGKTVDQSFLLREAERVAELNPDMIVLTGDFMSCEDDEEIPQALDVIRALPKAPLGRLAVLGNHDYAMYWRRAHVADKLTAGLERLDVRVLRNEATAIGGLQFAGTDDYWSRNFRPELCVHELATDMPTIALCHNPDGVDDPAFRDFRGWVLSGHTHGGQCKPPFLPPPLLPVKNRRYVAGEYDLGPVRRLYINRGLGYLKRVRFNARPEITAFTLARA